MRLSGLKLAPADRDWMERRAARQLGKLAPHIERISVRFTDVNGPRGGKDILCRARVLLSGRPTVIAEDHAAEPREAFARASTSLARSVRSSIKRAGMSTPKEKAAPTPAARKIARAVTATAGSLIGRRVGRSAERLREAQARPEKKRRDQPVDTSLPGVSATARKVGLRGTATRNTKLNRRGMVVTLEDSATGKPSRKSTRRSANRAKSGSQLGRRTKRTLHSSKARARRAQVHSGR